MLDFLKTPAGVAVFTVAAVVIFLLIIEINYKYFAKLCLDFLFAAVATVLCSPVLIACAVISKRNSEEGKALESAAYLGAGGKVVYLHAFSGVNKRVRYTARLFDVLCGRLSFVGVKPLPVEDGALMDDAAMERFTARPGIVSHLALTGNPELTYEEMFALDIRYAKKRGFFYDIWILIVRFVTFIRGENGSFAGETSSAGYTETLLARGAITQEEAASAREYAAEALQNDKNAKEFKKQRYRR